VKEKLLKSQKGEITEHLIYLTLAKKTSDPKNREILEGIAKDELKHYNTMKNITKTDVKPDLLHVWWYSLLASFFGLTFALKLMEKGEGSAQETYSRLKSEFPEMAKIIRDEEAHEMAIISLISEEKLEYASSVVLGLNDALVELSGALAGLTFALQNGKTIAIAGFIVGLAAALSMAASSYLSAMEESGKGKEKDPVKSAIYTGMAYIITVLVLILPYFLFENIYAALATMLIFAALIIACYTFYITTAKGQKFIPRFTKMLFISLAVTFISFSIGLFVRTYLGVEV